MVKLPPLSYMKRTTDYYLALGYDNPYQWAHFDDVPFAQLQKSLNELTLAIVTTAAPYQADKGDQGPGAAYNADAKFYRVYALPSDLSPDLRIAHVAIDRDHTSAEDMNCYFPLRALKTFANNGQIKSIAPRFYGLPTNRSKRTTIEQDCRDLITMIKDDHVDAVIFVPNCPICHQSVSLAARQVEAEGIATVIMGCAKDIVEHCGVPRFVFSDFPLGNSAGRPHDAASQRETLQLALTLLTEAKAPRTTVHSPLEWDPNHGWKNDYSNPAKLTEDEIKSRRKAFDDAKQAAQAIRQKTDQG